MSACLSEGARHRRRATRPLLLLAASLFLFAWPPMAVAQSDPGAVVRVEEQWELVVSSPDPNLTAPQVTCTFSPLPHLSSLYATLELNHQSLPEFVPGGMQLQLWDNQTPLVTRKYPNPEVLSTPGEVITWTQAISLANGQLVFEITNGSSTTWGGFGNQGYLRASVATTLTSLDNYDPSVSANTSGVGFAANRVASLVLKRVRVYTAGGQVFEDDTERTVHPKP